MSNDTWHSYTTPPDNDRIVRLRFDDTGKWDCDGFCRGSYYISESGHKNGWGVHPVAWSERQEGDR